MRRLVLLVLIAALAAVGILYGLRRAERTPHATVTALLPRGTIALAHFPDFNHTRDEWHRSDLYKLYQERAVQDFLNKPFLKVPQRVTAADTAGEIERLDLKDAFVAVTSIENNNPHFVGGSRFRGSESDAEKIIEKNLAKYVGRGKSPASQEYFRTFSLPGTVHAACEDYRAGATIDLQHDKEDKGKKVACPLLVLWAKSAPMGRLFDVPATWRARASNVSDQSKALPGGHNLPEGAPKEVTASLKAFLRS